MTLLWHTPAPARLQCAQCREQLRGGTEAWVCQASCPVWTSSGWAHSAALGEHWVVRRNASGHSLSSSQPCLAWHAELHRRCSVAQSKGHTQGGLQLRALALVCQDPDGSRPHLCTQPSPLHVQLPELRLAAQRRVRAPPPRLLPVAAHAAAQRQRSTSTGDLLAGTFRVQILDSLGCLHAFLTCHSLPETLSRSPTCPLSLVRTSPAWLNFLL